MAIALTGFSTTVANLMGTSLEPDIFVWAYMAGRLCDQPWRHRHLEVFSAIPCYKFNGRYLDTSSWEQVVWDLKLLYVACVLSIDRFVLLERKL